MPIRLTSLFTSSCLALAGLSAGFAAHAATPAASFSQDTVPTQVQVPSGNVIAWETVGTGEITYECRANVDAAGGAAWAFAGPVAVLKDRNGKQVGKYWGPPATWEAMDGSKLTGKELATAPAGAGNLPFQLVQANPVVGKGALEGVTYIQRVALVGGVAPANSPCDKDKIGAKEKVKYQADYIFWKAN